MVLGQAKQVKAVNGMAIMVYTKNITHLHICVYYMHICISIHINICITSLSWHSSPLEGIGHSSSCLPLASLPQEFPTSMVHLETIFYKVSWLYCSFTVYAWDRKVPATLVWLWVMTILCTSHKKDPFLVDLFPPLYVYLGVQSDTALSIPDPNTLLFCTRLRPYHFSVHPWCHLIHCWPSGPPPRSGPRSLRATYAHRVTTDG